MVTDLARRNISRFCAELGVENIIVADNIEWKRKMLEKYKSMAKISRPRNGYFYRWRQTLFRHVQDVKKQTEFLLICGV